MFSAGPNQSKYLERHNAAFKVLFFELLRDPKLVDKVPPCYSKGKPGGYEDGQSSGKDSEYHGDALSVR